MLGVTDPDGERHGPADDPLHDRAAPGDPGGRYPRLGRPRVPLGRAAARSSSFLGCALLFAARPTAGAARRVFLVSVLYLPVLLGLMVFDR